MKRTTLERQVSQYLDGELPTRDLDQVRAALEHDSELQLTARAWREMRTWLSSRETPPIQTSEAAWADLQRELRSSERGRQEVWPVFDSRFRWAAASMTVMLLAGFVWFVSSWLSPRATMVAELGAARVMGRAVEVEWVEAELPGATSMVFQDDDTGLTVIWLVESNGEGTGSS